MQPFVVFAMLNFLMLVLVLVCVLLIIGSDGVKSLSPPCSNSSAPCEYFNINCDPQCPSISLEDIALKANTSSSVYVDINVSELQLYETAHFTNLKVLSLNGNQSLRTTINCTAAADAGLVMLSIESITFSDITVTNCGALIQSKRANYSSAVTILNGQDVKVFNIVIMNSLGAGLALLNHRGGHVQIESSKFLQNSFPHNNSILTDTIGGSGTYIGDFEFRPLGPITFRFISCVFEENVANVRDHDHLYTSDLGEQVNGSGRGGGAAIFLKEGLTNIHVVFSNCIFTKNEASIGAGLFSTIYGASKSETRNVSIRLENSVFKENGCSSSDKTAAAAFGGGMCVSFNDSVDAFTLNSYDIYNVTYKSNCAQFGGGIYLFTFPKRKAEHSNKVKFEGCTFEDNQAHIGSAIDISPYRRLSEGSLVTPVFRHCTFSNNLVEANFNLNHTQATYGIATVYVSLYSIKLEGSNVFENNLGTAIHIVNGNIDMSQSNVTFISNTGVKGGAIALIGVSSIIIGPGKYYEYVNNTALQGGGALFVKAIDSHDFTVSKECFIRYAENTPVKDWKATIIFDGNWDRSNISRGHAIFATSLHSCKIINFGTKEEPKYRLINDTDLFSTRGIIFNNNLNPEKGELVSTAAGLLQYPKQKDVQIVPGELFEHGATFQDDLGNEKDVVLTVAHPKRSKDQLLPDTSFSLCFGKNLKIKGKVNVNDMLYLHGITSSCSSYIQLNVTLLDCPPGFIFNESTLTCICNHKSYIGLIRCNTTKFVSYITPGYWIGEIEDSKDKTRRELMTSYCFLYYCNYNDSCKQGKTVQLPKEASKLNEALCGKSRRGVACGSCAPGYTTYFHSPTYQCKPADPDLCKIGWVFYIFSELVPVTVVFVIVIVFNLNFASGTLNGFILFSQLVYTFNEDSSGLVKFPLVIAKLMEGSRLLYGVFSLDFFQAEAFSFCLFPTASSLDMVAFKYVTIVYALVMVIMTVWFMNNCGGRCLGKCCRITTVKSSVIHGLSAFLILCYSQCIKTSLNLLDNFGPNVRVGSNFTVSRRVWLNGNVVYFSKKHLPYAIPALFCLLTIGILPPALLLAYPLLNKVLALMHLEESKLVKTVFKSIHISSLKPLLDTFQGSFKDNMRFFAGLHFMYRCMVMITSVMPSSGFSRYYLSVNILITVTLALHALCQPYSKRAHNMIDTLLLADLNVIVAISFFHLYVFRTRVSHQTSVGRLIPSAVLQLLLIYTPLLIMAVCVLVSVYRLGCGQKCKDEIKSSRKFTKLRKLANLKSREDSIDKDAEDSEFHHRLVGGSVDYEKF